MGLKNKSNPKSGLPVKVSAAFVRLVKSDAKVFRKTKDGIVEAALRNLFALKQSERARFYVGLPAKILGRPIR